MLTLALLLSFGFVTEATYRAPFQTSTGAAQLSGRVVEEGTGAPVSSAVVILLPQPRNAGGPLPQAITDQDGRYTFEGMAPGRYRVDVVKAGILPPAEPAKVPNATLAAGQVIDDWNVSVRKGGAIAGRILDQFGQPLVDVMVRAVPRSATGAAPSQATVNSPFSRDPMAQGFSTNDLGEFRVFGLAPGEYLLTATPQQRFGFQNSSTDTSLLASTFYPGVSDAAAAQTIVVTAGETAGSVEFRLLTTPGFSVSGVVVDQAGMPMVGAMVMLRGDPRSGVAIMGPVGQSSTDANGMFLLRNVPSGSYYAMAIPVFRAIAGSGLESGVIVAGAPDAPAADPIEVIVSEADVEGVTIVVRPRQ